MKPIRVIAGPHAWRLTQSRAAFVLSRLGFGLFTFVTAFYCLLFYIPFSRHALFGWTMVPALTAFARYHPLIYWLAAAAVSVTTVPYLKKPALRRATIGFMAMLTTVGGVLSFWPLLPNLPEDERTLIWSVICLFPLWWIAALDWKSADSNSGSSTSRVVGFKFRDIAAIGTCVSTLYLGIFSIRYAFSAGTSFSRSQFLLVAASTLASHLLLFWLIFSAFKVVDAISERFSASVKLALVARSALVAVAMGLILQRVVFVAVSFNGLSADLAAILVSASFVAFASTSILRFSRLGSTIDVSRLTLTRRTIFKTRAWRLVFLTASLTAISVFAYTALLSLQGVDWQGLLQRLSVLVVWLATFIVFLIVRHPQPAKRYSTGALILMLMSGPGLYVAIQLAKPMLARVSRQNAPQTALIIEQYSDYDPSFCVAQEILLPTTVDVFEGSRDDEFFAMLRQNTNLPRAVAIEPVEFRLVDDLKPTSTPKPYIFVFVIDSLRQDYLSPYNHAVHFTPAIENFARENVVMKNAFTRYGGTALAEPSIWSGGMQAHKQFVQPFYPMNSLQRLLDAESYRSFVTIDPVLKSILRPSSDIVELDRGVGWMDYDLVGSLAELQAKIDEHRMNRPVFAFTQAQNLHLVSLKRSNRHTQSERYAGFARQHAAEVERIDRAFGDFIEFLKSRGLYDESVVILTADHGDSLGEDGHWGHGNSIYPEVIRIPLIIHLPRRFQGFANDPNAVAFSTDITPTLYYLLGHRPIRNDAMFGRPLFTETMQEQQTYIRDSYLIVDSYGPVYGLLRNTGRTLFVADGVKNRAYIYDLTRGYGGRRISMTDEAADEYKLAITAEVRKIQAFYNFQPRPQTAGAASQSSTLAQLYSLLFSN